MHGRAGLYSLCHRRNAYLFLTHSKVQSRNPSLCTASSSSCLNRHFTYHAGHAHAMDVCGYHTWSKEVHKNDSLIQNYKLPCISSFGRETEPNKGRQCKNTRFDLRTKLEVISLHIFFFFLPLETISGGVTARALCKRLACVGAMVQNI